MKIKMLLPVLGGFHNDPNGVQAGEIVDLDEYHARRYVEHGLAEPAVEDVAHF